jgi:hypothetical protein
VTKTWWRIFSSRNEILEWKLDELSQFQIATPKFVWGKLEWSSFNGNKTSFRFSTNAVMMDKIEKYVHKLIIKNFQRRQQQMPETETAIEPHLKIVHSKAA